MKRNNPSKLPRGLASTAIRPATILALLTVAAAALAAPNPNPRVLPPDSTPYGKSYAEWHAAWWKWAFETPADESPVLDETGEFCHVGQSGPVWFLAGTASFGGSGSVERTCTVPAGKALFFPLLNNFWVQLPTDPEIPEECAQDNYECLRKDIRIPAGAEVHCEIDGVPVQNLSAYHTESTVFKVNSTEGSLIFVLGGELGLFSPSLDDGYYLMLAPLRAGRHTIHLFGRNGDFVTEASYDLLVE